MPAPDDGFAGTSGKNLPEADIDLSCKNGNTPVHPEVVVDVKQDLGTGDIPQIAEDGAEIIPGGEIEAEDFEREKEQWVRIPVTEVTEWVNKDGPADMSRTAKVKFPFEWGGQSIIQYINGFNSQNNLAEQNDPYDECRIFFYDNDLDEWVTAHYGYVGGIGPANNSEGVGKFWVYDPADLMKGIQVSKSWAEPTISTVLDFALRGIDETGDEVGIERRSVFDKKIPVSFVGKQNLPQDKQQDVRERDPEGFAITGNLPVVGSFRLPVPGLVGDLFESIADIFIDPMLGSQKRFQLNRHNMVDMMDWFTNLLDARWWFEPGVEGPVLCIDATAYKSGVNKKGNYHRRYFVDEASISEWKEVQKAAKKEAAQSALNEGEIEEFEAADQFEVEQAYGDGEVFISPDGELYNGGWAKEITGGKSVDVDELFGDYLPPHQYEIFGTVDTLNNTALADIKPFNTLYLYGESTAVRERYPSASTAAAPGLYTEKFPWVKVTYKPLVDRAGGYEYSAQPIESDKVYLEQAKQQAKKEFRKHLAEQTEGSMQLRGEPHLMPYDYLVTTPTCNDTYLNAEAEPMTWEVNGVKHVRKAGEPYKTELGVSLSIEDRLLDVEAEYRES